MNALAAAFAGSADTAGAALATYWRLFAGQQRRLLAAGAVYLVKHSPAVLLPVITGYTVDLLAQKAPPGRIALCALATALLIAQNLPGQRLYVRWVSQAVRGMEAAQREHRLAVEALGDSAAEMARLLPLTRAHGLEHAQMQRVGGHIHAAARTGLALDLAGGRFGALAWAGFQGLNALCLFVAAGAYASGLLPMTLGDVVLLSGFFVTLTHSVLGLAGLVPQIHRGIEAIRSVDELLRAAPMEPAAAEGPAALRGGLRFEDVTHRHEAGAGAGVQGITLDLEPGSTVALVGPSGSGKTTLAMLACGLLRPQQGRIRVEGMDLQAIEPRAWRRHVGWVPQDALMGDGSVRDSLVFGLGEVDDAQLQHLLRETGCAEFVARLPQGLDTPLGHHGHRLSGGERQRLALARALLREPRLLVLDEPTSALDGESERTVLAALARNRGERTTLVIAHRLSTVADADCIVVMDAGRIVDRGRHGELLARCELFRRMWQIEGTAT